MSALALYLERDRFIVRLDAPGPRTAATTIAVPAGGSISDALARAAAGTDVFVEPGEYRERLRLKDGVHIVSRVPRGASIRLPGGASETDAAVVAFDVAGAALSGFRIIGDAATPLGTGVIVRNSDLALSDVEITGAQTAAIEYAGGSGGSLVAGFLHDNPGAAIVVRAGASPRIAHNLFARNATSERAPGTLLVEADARPELTANTFQGVTAGVDRHPRASRQRAAPAQQLVQSGRIRSSARRGVTRQRAAMTTLFQRVGPYEIVREIGRGGMATVFLAEDTRHARKVALKLVSMTGDREGREILDAERWGAQLQGRLAEACGLVPRVYEDGEHAPYYFIAMEYVDGENLSDVIGRGQVAPDEASRIACELCRFLDTAHRFTTSIDGRDFVSLVHGDLKPRNVRLSPTGDIKVLDFGIAKALSLSRKVTRNDFGSMPYLSPERLDSTEVNAHADLWALGVILYELLSGAPPFHAVDTRRLEQQIRAGLPAASAGGPVSRAAPGRGRAPARAAPAGSLRVGRGGAVRSAALSIRTTDASGSARVPRRARTRRRRGGRIRRGRRYRSHAPDAPRRLPSCRRRRRPGRRRAAPAAGAGPARSHPVRTILMLAALFLACNELVVGFGARRAAASAMTRDLDAMTDVWTEYAGLSRRSYLRRRCPAPRARAGDGVQALAEQVIANYRSSLPTVRERQWRTAQRNLQQALVLAPENRTLKASLRYCEGHLHRIDGEAEKLRRRPDAANQHFTEAVSAFREAAELRRDWPDPFLGLARTFIYGLEDIDRAADAMRQAQKSGYRSAIARRRSLATATGRVATRSGRRRGGLPTCPRKPSTCSARPRRTGRRWRSTSGFPASPASRGPCAAHGGRSSRLRCVWRTWRTSRTKPNVSLPWR